MIKLALVGKNISHSRSPEMYKKILGSRIEYELLDYSIGKEIPMASDLLAVYSGINITSPYKKHFLKEVQLIGVANEVQAINCLRLKNGIVEGCNTDYLAIEKILKRHIKKNQNVKVVVLGDGVMANVVIHALSQLKMTYQQFSRKLTKSFHSFDLVDQFGNEKLLVINTCAREYVYQNKITPTSVFWDFNYSFDAHEELLSSKCLYEDGLEMLQLQAEYAVQFWSIKK